MINIGEYIEMAVEWLTEHGASFFDRHNGSIGKVLSTGYCASCSGYLFT